MVAKTSQRSLDQELGQFQASCLAYKFKASSGNSSELSHRLKNVLQRDDARCFEKFKISWTNTFRTEDLHSVFKIDILKIT